jgi:hypothetical protein
MFLMRSFLDKYMKKPLFLVLLFWILSANNGCSVPGEGRYSYVSVEKIKVNPLSEEYSTIAHRETGIVLNVTASIVNEGKEDSSALLIHFDLNEAYSTRELATKNVELDFHSNTPQLAAGMKNFPENRC